MYIMKSIIALALVMCVTAQAQPAAERLVAHTVAPNPERIQLLTESCGWPGGAMRAQLITQTNGLRWGCWGYNDTGVQIQWSTGYHSWISFADLWIWDGGFMRQMGYQTLHKRVLFLRNTQ